jgi:hypothetical protein
MRRTASEALRDLEVRIAHLESTANSFEGLTSSERRMFEQAKDLLNKLYVVANSKLSGEDKLRHKYNPSGFNSTKLILVHALNEIHAILEEE